MLIVGCTSSINRIKNTVDVNGTLTDFLQS